MAKDKDTHRQNFNLTRRDRDNIALIRAGHDLNTDTDALRLALERVARDVAVGGIGYKATEAERAYRDMVGASLTPDMPAWWAARHDEQREREALAE